MASYPIAYRILTAAAVSGLVLLGHGASQAANHREAPLTALDHKADITDFFAFVSYEEPSSYTTPEKVAFILDVDPLLEPGNGPNYFPFDPEICYAIRIDNNHDAIEDVVFEVRFETRVRLPGVFTSLIGAGLQGVPAPVNAPPDLNGNPTVGALVIPPTITALAGPGSQGLSLRQRYSMTMKRRVEGRLKTLFRVVKDAHGNALFAVPSNAGSRTMADYPALAKQGVFELQHGIRIFAGTVDDPFWIDLGAAFDSLNFRADAGGGILSATQDGNDASNFAPDEVAGYNVNAIAIEVPIALLTRDGQLHGSEDPDATIGSWGTTSRPKVKRFRGPGKPPKLSRSYRQVQRMGNPLFNELIIGTGFKDEFSMSKPKRDARFANFALDPLLARALNAATGGDIPIPTPPRLDLLPLVQYLPPICPHCVTPAEQGPIADLLRLNTGVPATPPAARRRLGLLAGDAAGFPNGRRVFDDVTDIAARAIAGVLAAPFPGFDPAIHGRIGDGVNTNDVRYQERFPYVAFAQSGRDSRHVDPGEPGCTGTCPVQ